MFIAQFWSSSLSAFARWWKSLCVQFMQKSSRFVTDFQSFIARQDGERVSGAKAKTSQLSKSNFVPPKTFSCVLCQLNYRVCFSPDHGETKQIAYLSSLVYLLNWWWMASRWPRQLSTATHDHYIDTKASSFQWSLSPWRKVERRANGQINDRDKWAVITMQENSVW